MDYSPLWISLKTVFPATAIAFVLGLLMAGWTQKTGRKLKGILDAVFTLPMVLPPTVLGFLLLLLFGKNGPVGQLLMQAGFTVVFSWPATVIAAAVVAFPLVYRTTRGAFEQVDENLLHAGRTLGLGENYIFWRILMPLAWPGTLSGIILGFARALGEFGATIMIAGNIAGRTQTIPIAIYSAVQGGDMKTAFFWVAIIMAVSLAVISLMNFFGARRPDGQKAKRRAQ
jgi:molybdate transport system permease protein